MADWAVKFDGKDPFPIGDLSPTEVQTVASKHGLSWLMLLEVPGSDPDALCDLIELVAKHVGVAQPLRPEKASEVRTLLAMLVECETDLPGSWVDGNPQVGDQTTE